MAKRSEIKVEQIRLVMEHDPDPDPSGLEREAEEGDAYAKKRLAAYEEGDWQYVGIFAEAEIIVKGTVQTIRTPGLWNTESDSGRTYLDEIGREEYADLKDILRSLGAKEIPALSTAKWKKRF